MGKKEKVVRQKSDDRKVEAEYQRKVADIKKKVRERKPMMNVKVPELPAKIGTLEFEHLVHPFKPNTRRPQDLIVNNDRAEAELKEKLRVVAEKKVAAQERARILAARDSDDSDSDDDKDAFLMKKKKKNARFEDFVIPNIIDSETGEELHLTRATWSVDEGRVNEDMATQLDRGTGKLKIANRPDFSHRIVPILSPRVNKAKSLFKRAGTKVLGVVAFLPRKKAAGVDAAVHEQEEDKRRREEAAVAAAEDAAAAAALAVQHNSLHHLHINLSGGMPSLGTETSTLATTIAGGHKLHIHGHDEVKHYKHIHSEKKMHPLVARFIRDGPQQPMYHKYWDKRHDAVKLPSNYVNDADNDAGGYCSHDEEIKMEHGDNFDEHGSPRGVVGANGNDGDSHFLNSARSTTSSVGFDSVETIAKDKSHPDKVGRPASTGALTAELEKAKRHGDVLLSENPLDKDKRDESTISIMSDALDPNNEITWRALEDSYYYEIREEALQYEANKIWTKEKPVKGGVGGMDIAVRAYANWKMRSMKFIVQASDEEEKRESARVSLEDELETNKPERLLAQAKLHNAERHTHRTYINTFKYDLEIVALKKLNDLGLVW